MDEILDDWGRFDVPLVEMGPMPEYKRQEALDEDAAPGEPLPQWIV